MFMSKLAEFTEHMNIPQMKEQIRQFGVASEIFEESLVPFVPRILGSLQRKIKEEGTARLHGAISESIGQMVWHIVDKLPSLEDQ